MVYNRAMRKYRNSIKRILASVSAGMLALTLSSCAVAQGVPDMDPAVEDEIVEYAVDAVMRHLKNYDSKIVDLSLYTDPEDYETPEPEEVPPTQMEPVEDTPSVDVSPQGEPEYTISDLLVPAGCSLAYTGYETARLYPDTGEIAFGVNATEGNVLLVMYFTLSNDSGNAAQVDIFGMNPRITATLDGDADYKVIRTWLESDLLLYRGSLLPGETTALTAVAEVPESYAGNIGSIDLTVRSDIGNTKQHIYP